MCPMPERERHGQRGCRMHAYIAASLFGSEVIEVNTNQILPVTVSLRGGEEQMRSQTSETYDYSFLFYLLFILPVF
jgi:hypothetical protein